MKDKRIAKRKVLVEFMRYKASLLGEVGKEFFTKKDEEILSNIALDRAEKMFDQLDLSICSTLEMFDYSICPYCYDVGEKGCEKCLYAKEHGICHKDGSTYDKITEEFTSIISIVGENLIKSIWHMLKAKHKLSGGVIYKPIFSIQLARKALRQFTIVLNTMLERESDIAIKQIVTLDDGDVSLLFTKIQRNLMLAFDNLLVANWNKVALKEVHPYCVLLHSVRFMSCEDCEYKHKCPKNLSLDVDVIVQLWENIVFDLYNNIILGDS